MTRRLLFLAPSKNRD